MADIYTVDSLARDAGVPKKAVKKWIKKGKLRAANLGSWLFPHFVMAKADVWEFLRNNESMYTKGKCNELPERREGRPVSSD
jgi:2-keto-3-deoxy-6-phosphogluconate aldolase